MLTDSMYNGRSAPVMITFAPAMTPESLQTPKSSTKASALGLPSPITPPSTPCPLLRASRTPPSRSMSTGDPYPTPSPESKRRRCKPSSNKRAMNAFLIYRKNFPSLYPHIDALERHQGPKSAIIGAMWRAEPPEVKEHFFGLQELAAEEFRISTGQLMLSKSDPIKTLIRRDKARERRAKDEKLAPRSELIVRLWMENKSDEDLVAAVKEYDEQNEKKVDSSLYVRPLANHTNTPLPTVSTSPMFRATALSSPATIPSPLPLCTPSPQPEPQPQIVSPELDFNDPVVSNLVADYLQLNGLPQLPTQAKCDDGEDLFSDLFRPMQTTPSSWEVPAQGALFYEAPLDAIMSGFALNESPVSGSVSASSQGMDALPTFELGGLENLNALGSYNDVVLGDSTDYSSLIGYYTELASFPEYQLQ